MTDKQKIQLLRAALGKFASYGYFLRAAVEYTGQTDKLKESTCIASCMAGGGSDYLWWVDFLNAMSVMEQTADEEDK